MIKQSWKFLVSTKPVIIDGGLAVCIAMFLMAQTVFSSEEAYKYINPMCLFWMKAFFGIFGAGFGALKAFRGTEFSKHQSDVEKAKNGLLPNAPTGAEPPKKETNEDKTS